MTKPVLSIGIIFRNDIRSIERCLKALQPLRDAVPSELVMADTGSDDGSREVAARYADILFDFPWVDDFAAARNAVMDRCSGKWYFSVDTDEYLSGDVAETAEFLRSGDDGTTYQAGSLTIRNYGSYEIDGNYLDFVAGRMVRMSTGVRYVGRIHEQLAGMPENRRAIYFPQIRLDHDGYVALNDKEKGKAKRDRNLKLIRRGLEEKPDDLLLHMQLLESGGYEPDFVEHLRETVELLKRRGLGWTTIGPPLLRYAVYIAKERDLPEVPEWIALAEEWYPDSVFTRIDVEYQSFVISWSEENYEDCVQRGERYLATLARYRNGEYVEQMMFGVLQMASPYQEQAVRIALASAYGHINQIERAFELLAGLDTAQFDPKQTSDSLMTLQEVHYRSDLDTEPVVRAFWQAAQDKDQKLAAFFSTAGTSFMPQNQEYERSKADFHRPGYTLYLPLRGECEAGAAAAVLQTQDVREIETALSEVEDWEKFPVWALLHALEQGASFPPAGRDLCVEEMDAVAGRLSQTGERFLSLAAREESAAGDAQKICWARGAAIAAVRVFNWKDEGADADMGMALARVFARAEAAFLPLCYAPGVLGGGELFLLPPMHRFGWYCAQAFRALDAGDTAGYVRLLREGLSASESMKPMVEFLTEHTPELKDPSEELAALAAQLRTVLARFAPDDPAVAALKQSETYQKVAYLIEGAEPPIAGGQLQ